MANTSNYVPQPVTQSQEATPRYLTNEFRKIQQAISSTNQAASNASNITTGTLPTSVIPAPLPNSVIPDPTATALGGVKSATAPASQWMNGINTAGSPTFSQPAFGNISGNLGWNQAPVTGNYTFLYDPSGGSYSQFLMGNSADPSMYLRANGNINIQNAAGSTSYGTFNSSGLSTPGNITASGNVTVGAQHPGSGYAPAGFNTSGTLIQMPATGQIRYSYFANGGWTTGGAGGMGFNWRFTPQSTGFLVVHCKIITDSGNVAQQVSYQLTINGSGVDTCAVYSGGSGDWRTVCFNYAAQLSVGSGYTFDIYCDGIGSSTAALTEYQCSFTCVEI